jgi:hypothetical protein
MTVLNKRAGEYRDDIGINLDRITDLADELHSQVIRSGSPSAAHLDRITDLAEVTLGDQAADRLRDIRAALEDIN